MIKRLSTSRYWLLQKLLITTVCYKSNKFFFTVSSYIFYLKELSCFEKLIFEKLRVREIDFREIDFREIDIREIDFREIDFREIYLKPGLDFTRRNGQAHVARPGFPVYWTGRAVQINYFGSGGHSMKNFF